MGLPVSKRMRERYSLQAIMSHMRRFHPGCPDANRDKLVALIADRSWESASLGKAFGIVASNYVRHELTDYDPLRRRHGLMRDEARMIVAQEVEGIMRAWRIGPPTW